MAEANKQRLGLLSSINEMFELYESGEKIEAESWDDVGAALSSLGVPPENIMLHLAKGLKGGSGRFP
jgi:hypothetical protein